MNRLALVVVLVLPTLASQVARAQGTTSIEEPTTTEEAQRAQAAAHDQPAAAAEAREGAEQAEDEHVPGLLDDADHPERGVAHHPPASTTDAALSTAVFPPAPPRPPEDPDPELEEDLIPPLVEPEWRLRLGVGATVATAGGPVASLRLTQEVEWMPLAVAPILFSITGGEVLGEYTMGLGGARIGLYGVFCMDRIVTCTGAIALRGGVVGGTPGVTFDLGGDGDARFRFDGVELTVRVGFFVIQSVTFVDLVGMVGAAF